MSPEDASWSIMNDVPVDLVLSPSYLSKDTMYPVSSFSVIGTVAVTL